MVRTSDTVWGLVVAIGGTAAAVGLGFVSLIMASFAFDSPLRKASTNLVMGLLVGSIAAGIVSSLLLGAGLAFRAAPYGRGLLIGGALVGVVAAIVFAGFVGYTLFGG